MDLELVWIWVRVDMIAYLPDMSIPFLHPNAYFDGLVHKARRNDDGVQEALGRRVDFDHCVVMLGAATAQIMPALWLID